MALISTAMKQLNPLPKKAEPSLAINTPITWRICPSFHEPKSTSILRLKFFHPINLLEYYSFRTLPTFRCGRSFLAALDPPMHQDSVTQSPDQLRKLLSCSRYLDILHCGVHQSVSQRTRLRTHIPTNHVD